MKYVVLLAALTVFNGFANSQAAELPVEAFASIPAYSMPRLSPDGTKLSFVQTLSSAGQQYVFVRLYDLTTGEKKVLVKASIEDTNVDNLLWANNELLLVDASYATRKFDVPVTNTRLMVVDVNSGENYSAVDAKLARKFLRMPQFQSEIVSMLPEDDEHILLQLDGLTQGYGVSLVKINIKNGKHEVIAYDKENLRHWLVDQQRNPRLAIFVKDGLVEVYEKQLSSGELKKLWQFAALSEQEVWPLGFDVQPNLLYVSAYHEGRKAIFKVDLATDTLERTLVKANANFDVPEHLDYNPLTGEVIGAGGEFIAAEYVALQQAVDAALPDAKNDIISISRDKNRYLVASSNETDAGSYFLGDKKTKSMTYLLSKYSELDPDMMVAKQKISYQARDKLTIEGYLTTPKGYEKGVLPTIIFPHGGPISFDDGDFDYWTQFFANRGYAVLQMNFRGSYGYGFDFMQMGLQGWGAQMQDDVEDGTRWLIEQGIADPKRICIVGASYGGYAALMGVVKTPDLYQCAVSFAGVSDVESLVKYHRNYTNYAVVKKQIGDDFSLLEQNSPLTHVDKINVPVLLLHGTDDRSVPYQQSDMMYKALLRQNKPVEYIEFDKGDHYLSNNSHRLETFKAMDRFLKQHLKAN